MRVIPLLPALMCALEFLLPSMMPGQQAMRADNSAGAATVRVAVLGDKPVYLIHELLVLSFQEEHGKTDLADRFVDGVRKDKASGIPYGTYNSRIYVDGVWGAAEQTVKVSQPAVLVVIDTRGRPPRPIPISQPIGDSEIYWGSVDWPQLEGPHCVRSVCYVDVMDTIQ